MPPAGFYKTRTDNQLQKEKLVESYQQLLEEFSDKDLRNVGNYSLGALIGKGSFGKVYLARHKLTNGSKVVLKSSSRNDGNLAREIHHHRQFQHPHIARLYEVIVTETMVWLVLEYCPGNELYNYLIRNGPMAIDKVQRIFSQLVGAVTYVHSKSCVHRDLKLENILLDKNENVKLCDFGFTRGYDGKANYLSTFCGTVCYSAPEMLKGEKYAAEKVDVWSLGIILYALIAGELPFDEDDDQVTKQLILTQEPKYTDRFPEDAKQLVSQLLSKRSFVRPALIDVLNHPFLAEYAPLQHAILKIARPPPFSTPLEKLTLDRMRCAGVNVDHVVESVLSQRCDALAGWWALLIEKEERKEKRRERKRKEREAEVKSNRRLSGASSQVNRRISAALAEVQEENGGGGGNGGSHGQLQSQGSALSMVRTRSRGRTGSRGRAKRRSIPNPQLLVPDTREKSTPTNTQILSPTNSTLSHQQHLAATNVSTRSASPSVSRPEGSSKGGRPELNRQSTLHVSKSQPDLAHHSMKRGGRRRHHNFMHQLASIKHWFVESTKRSKSPNGKQPPSSSGNNAPGGSGAGSGGSAHGGHGGSAGSGAAATAATAAATDGEVSGSSKFLSTKPTMKLQQEGEPKPGSPSVNFKGIPVVSGAGAAAGGGSSAGVGRDGVGLGRGGGVAAVQQQQQQPLPSSSMGGGSSVAHSGTTTPTATTTTNAAGGMRVRMCDSDQGRGKGPSMLNGNIASYPPPPSSPAAAAAATTARTPPSLATTPKPRHINTATTTTNNNNNPTSNPRNSMSPVPLTPRTPYRLSATSGGLRGRKSTSSSVSSIRSMPQHKHSLSKASSISSNSVDTISLPTSGSRKNLRSPHPSIKVLPTTPNASTHLPPGIRLVRGAPAYKSSSAAAAAATSYPSSGFPPYSPSSFSSYSSLSSSATAAAAAANAAPSSSLSSSLPAQQPSSSSPSSSNRMISNASFLPFQKQFGNIGVAENMFNERAPSPLFGPAGAGQPSMVFARRRRPVFRGPSLASSAFYARDHGGGGGGGGGLGTPGLPRSVPPSTIPGRVDDGFEDINESEDEGIVEEEEEEEDEEEGVGERDAEDEMLSADDNDRGTTLSDLIGEPGGVEMAHPASDTMVGRGSTAVQSEYLPNGVGDGGVGGGDEQSCSSPPETFHDAKSDVTPLDTPTQTLPPPSPYQHCRRDGSGDVNREEELRTPTTHFAPDTRFSPSSASSSTHRPPATAYSLPASPVVRDPETFQLESQQQQQGQKQRPSPPSISHKKGSASLGGLPSHQFSFRVAAESRDDDNGEKSSNGRDGSKSPAKSLRRS